MNPPTFEQIQEILSARKEELSRDYGVAEIGIFGSYARNEATAASDIDVLVEFSAPIGFFKFLELEERLSEWLGAKVDLVSKPALKPYIGRQILAEVVML